MEKQINIVYKTPGIGNLAAETYGESVMAWTLRQTRMSDAANQIFVFADRYFTSHPHRWS